MLSCSCVLPSYVSGSPVITTTTCIAFPFARVYPGPASAAYITYISLPPLSGRLSGSVGSRARVRHTHSGFGRAYPPHYAIYLCVISLTSPPAARPGRLRGDWASKDVRVRGRYVLRRSCDGLLLEAGRVTRDVKRKSPRPEAQGPRVTAALWRGFIEPSHVSRTSLT